MPPLGQRSIESSLGSIPPVRPLLFGQSMESASVRSQRLLSRPIPLLNLGQSSAISSAASSNEGIDFSGVGHNDDSDEETRLLTKTTPLIPQVEDVNNDDDFDTDDLYDDEDDLSQVLLTPTPPQAILLRKFRIPTSRLKRNTMLRLALWP